MSTVATKLDAIELDTDVPVTMRVTHHGSGRVYRVELVYPGWRNTIKATGDMDAALDVMNAAIAVGHPVLD